MKKIFLILFLLVSSIGSSQTYNANLFKGNIFRISDSLNLRGAYSYWGTNGHVFNLNLSTLGRFLFKMNGTTDLLDYDYDNGYWTSYKSWLVNGDMNITGSYKVNGVVTGGGDAYLSNRQTFTKRNTFDSLNVTKIVSDLPFYKASNTWLWTKDNFPLFLGANSDTAMMIDNTTNDVRVYENLNVDNSITANEVNATTITNLTGMTTLTDVGINGSLDLTGATISGEDVARVELGLDKITNFSDADDPFDISATDKTVRLSAISLSMNVYLPPANSVNAGYEIILEDGTGQLNSTTRVLTVHRSGTDLINADSLITMTAPYTFRRFISNGSNRWNYDGGIVRLNETQTLTNKTLTNPTLTTPSLGIATATSINKVAITAPATSATLTIANGKTLTVNNSITLNGTDGTTMTMPSTSSTLAGLENTNTWSGTTNTFTDIVGNYIKTDNTYVATKVVQAYISSTGAFVNIAHGLGGAKWKDITNLSAVVIHDSTGLGNYTVLGLGYNGNVANTVGSVLLADSLDAKYFVPASSTGLKGDTVKITIQYHK